MKRRIPESIDLSQLEFLEYGDKTRIAREEREAGRKTDVAYVSKVCAGIHRNDRILRRAFQIAISRASQYPKQAFKNPIETKVLLICLMLLTSCSTVWKVNGVEVYSPTRKIERREAYIMSAAGIVGFVAADHFLSPDKKERISQIIKK